MSVRSHNQKVGAIVPHQVVKLRPLSDCGQDCNLLNRRVSRRSQLQVGSKLSSGMANSNGELVSSSNYGGGKVFTTLNAVDIKTCLGNSYDTTDIKLRRADQSSRQQVENKENLCHHCKDSFLHEEPMVNLNGLVWHQRCFVCAQCFQPFADDLFFEFGGRLYCAHDFQILFAPFCSKCKEFIMGRVIKAMNGNWHPQCFLCDLCMTQLADTGFVRNANRALCKSCNEEERLKRIGKHVCAKCNIVIDDEELLRYKGEVFHPYHFNCHSCGCELTGTARIKDNELYCLRCHDKLGIPICGACRRPIEERVVHALGKTWHVEHFVCSHCEKPFLGNRHYERKGLAYCEIHYHQLYGNTCFHCNNVITGNAFSAFNKNWCQDHFACFSCNHKMDQKTKFIDFDGKPTCKNCYKKFPSELVKRHKKFQPGK